MTPFPQKKSCVRHCFFGKCNCFCVACCVCELLFIAGRKRMHLELKETMTRMGTDLRQKVLDRYRYLANVLLFLFSASVLL